MRALRRIVVGRSDTFSPSAPACTAPTGLASRSAPICTMFPGLWKKRRRRLNATILPLQSDLPYQTRFQCSTIRAGSRFTSGQRTGTPGAGRPAGHGRGNADVKAVRSSQFSVHSSQFSAHSSLRLASGHVRAQESCALKSGGHGDIAARSATLSRESRQVRCKWVWFGPAPRTEWFVSSARSCT